MNTDIQLDLLLVTYYSINKILLQELNLLINVQLESKLIFIKRGKDYMDSILLRTWKGRFTYLKARAMCLLLENAGFLTAVLLDLPPSLPTTFYFLKNLINLI